MGEGWTDHSPVPADLGMDVVDIACKIILTISFIFDDGIRPSQEPARRFFKQFSNQTWCQGGNDLVQMEMLHLAVALKYILLDPTRIWYSTFSCQV